MLRLKITCWSLLFLGICFSSKLISCRVAAADGPARMSTSGAEANVTLKLKVFGFPILADVGKMDVRSFVQSGQRIEAPFQRFTKAVVTSFSIFALVLPAACLMWLRTQAQNAAETFGSPPAVTEVDVEMGMGMQTLDAAPRDEVQFEQPFGMQTLDAAPRDEAQFEQPLGMQTLDAVPRDEAQFEQRLHANAGRSAKGRGSV